MLESELKQTLLAAYKRLLKPLVRILIRNGVSFAEFGDVAKEVFVEVAERDFRLPNKKATRARIAILTGLTNKEVNRVITRMNSSTEGLMTNLNRVTRILTGWHTDPEFTGPYGLALEVPFNAPSGRSFSELARRYTRDTPARAMLDELVRIGVVKETEKGSYRVLTRTYMPKVDAPDSLERLALTVGNFVETVDYNRVVEEPDERLFERNVVADDGIRQEDLPRFKAYLRQRAQLLLEEIDDWLSQVDKPDPDGAEPVIQTGVGIYHFVQRDSDA